jgi:3'(2'), 5'-bisphosphate nucleotidase
MYAPWAHSMIKTAFMKYENIDVDFLVSLAQKAGDAIMEVYARDFSVEMKDDRSPLTEADKKSNAVILAGLNERYPSIPFISEETKLTPYSERKDWAIFWLIDPLDGTKEFIKKNGEFTVNIALIKNGIPVLGVVYVPAQGKTYYGVEGHGAFKLEDRQAQPERIHPSPYYAKKDKVNVVGSRSHMDERTMAFVDHLKAEGKEVDFISSGSSLKFCLVAEGKADVYPRFAPTMEWDTGAAHAVVRYAGKNVLDNTTRQPLRYNKENLLNPYFIVE